MGKGQLRRGIYSLVTPLLRCDGLLPLLRPCTSEANCHLLQMLARIPKRCYPGHCCKIGDFEARKIVHDKRFSSRHTALSYIPLARLWAGPVPLRREIYSLVTLLLRCDALLPLLRPYPSEANCCLLRTPARIPKRCYPGTTVKLATLRRAKSCTTNVSSSSLHQTNSRVKRIPRVHIV